MKNHFSSTLRLAFLALVASSASAQSTVVAWGDNSHGECDVPVPPGGTSYVELDAGREHTLARLSDDSVVAWGGNSEGQCNVPALPPGARYLELAGGAWHSLARRSDGSVVAWGNNADGQCNVPAPASGSSYVAVAAGWWHSAALRSDGAVVAWGANHYGQCNVPAPPSGVACIEVEAGMNHTAARFSDGSVVAWGRNTEGQCNVPALPPGTSYIDIDAGSYWTLGIRSDGGIVRWGADLPDAPALPSGMRYAEVAGFSSHAVARRSDGSVVAWGVNNFGQCDVPPPPPGTVCVGLAAGYGHSVARWAFPVPPPAVYCTAKTNSLGCVPAIGFSGTLALSGPDDFVIGASNVRSFRAGLLFWSRTPAAVPFHGGVLCAAPPLVRTHVQDSLGTPGVDDCSGAFGYDLTNDYLNANALVAGDELYAQYWSRDASAPPFFTGLTDALHMWVGP